ncbi:MAG: prolipoprotein diacylglyceryl transferase [Armatimonadetes bacterium]|nr:prolipoprotein diacylglyceryl transferase [Armatimonadota bacterium]
MRPILLRVEQVDPGGVLLALLILFLLTLLWRRAARALGEDVPPLTSVAVLGSFLFSLVLTVGASLIISRFGFDIKSYGAMLVLGFVAATLWAIRDGTRRGHQPAIFLDLAIYVLVGAVVGARLAYVALDWHAYEAHPEAVLALWQGGLSFHGGVAGALLTGAIFCWRYRKPFWEMADIVAPGVALGYSFGRVGCFLNGCCYGVPTHLPWGVRFPTAAFLDGRPINEPVHPTQLYGAAASLVIFGLLLLARRYLRVRGHVFALYIALYSIYRFLVEFLRHGVTGAPLPDLPILTVGQVVSAALFLIAAAGMAATWRRDRGRR